MPGTKREAQDQLSKDVHEEVHEEEMDLEFEDPWDDEFSDASVDQEELEQNDEDLADMDDVTNEQGTAFN
jgi:hypothetical protein